MNRDPLFLGLYAAVGVALIYGYRYVTTDHEEYGGLSGDFKDKGQGEPEGDEDLDLDGGLSPDYREL